MPDAPIEVTTSNPLATPRGAGRRANPYDAEAFGRFAEGLARLLGTARFIVGQTILIIIWIILNVVGLIHHWDPYPFILLNLAFSTQAAYAAPLILLAQNRQDDRDRLNIERDREVATRTQADTDFLARELASLRITVEGSLTSEELREGLRELLAELRGEDISAPGPAA
ncbi:MAG: DUF1003 domain-containing protein [Actinomycetota bacterium]|nr:DUF1003 domain-containing protein [Actinomycetota bacterium]